MFFVLIRHTVADFSAWKKVYDAHLPFRQKAGLKENHVLHGADDANEVVTLFSASDLDKVREFAESADLRQAMQKAGVIGRPEVSILKEG